jgi:uncharacterized damage-inducible protein DinB
MSVFTNPASASKEHSAAYIAALLGLVGDDDAIGVLRRTPAAVRAAIDGLSAAQLIRREQPGKWSVSHVIQHVADAELVFGWRLRMVLAHDRPRLQSFDQDLWAERLGYDEADAAQALTEFTVLRGSNLRLLERASPADLQRAGVHEERGEESVAHLMRLYAGHDRMHLQQLARIRQAIS